MKTIIFLLLLGGSLLAVPVKEDSEQPTGGQQQQQPGDAGLIIGGVQVVKKPSQPGQDQSQRQVTISKSFAWGPFWSRQQPVSPILGQKQIEIEGPSVGRVPLRRVVVSQPVSPFQSIQQQLQQQQAQQQQPQQYQPQQYQPQQQHQPQQYQPQQYQPQQYQPQQYQPQQYQPQQYQPQQYQPQQYQPQQYQPQQFQPQLQPQQYQTQQQRLQQLLQQLQQQRQQQQGSFGIQGLPPQRGLSQSQQQQQQPWQQGQLRQQQQQPWQQAQSKQQQPGQQQQPWQQGQLRQQQQGQQQQPWQQGQLRQQQGQQQQPWQQQQQLKQQQPYGIFGLIPQSQQITPTASPQQVIQQQAASLEEQQVNLNQIKNQLQNQQQQSNSVMEQQQLQNSINQVEQLQQQSNQLGNEIRSVIQSGMQISSALLRQIQNSLDALQRQVNQVQQQVGRSSRGGFFGSSQTSISQQQQGQQQQPWQQQQQLKQQQPYGIFGLIPQSQQITPTASPQQVIQQQAASLEEQQVNLNQIKNQLQNQQQQSNSVMEQQQLQNSINQVEQLQQQSNQLGNEIRSVTQSGMQISSALLRQIQNSLDALQRQVNQVQQQAGRSSRGGFFGSSQISISQQLRGGPQQGQAYSQAGQKVTHVPGVYPMYGPGASQQVQQQARQGVNQWEEEENEQYTFQDIASEGQVRPQGPALQQQQQVGQAEAQNVQVSQQQEQIQIAEPQVLQKQSDVLRLVRNINQPSNDEQLVQVGNSYSILGNPNGYTSARAVRQFAKQVQKGLLPRGRIFSVQNPEHLKQAIALFKVLYHSRDWQTFVNTAAWARNNVNEGIYLYALSVALVQRGDTDLLVLPPNYEINPHYFINSHVIQKAQNVKQLVSGSSKPQQYVIHANYSGLYMNSEPDNHLAYFLEDISLNDYYYDYHLNYPFWLNTENLKLGGERRGEQAYYLHQQLLARYNLERLSNNVGPVQKIDLMQPVQAGYIPTLRHPNGLEFSSRPAGTPLTQHREQLAELYHSLRRIRDSIDAEQVIDENGDPQPLAGEQGFNTVANTIESNPDSPNPQFYGAPAQTLNHLIGNVPQPQDQNEIVAAATGHFETNLRDPAAWQGIAKLVGLAQRYKQNQPSYNQQQLEFPGVSVQNVQVDPLVTYFEQQDVDITEAVLQTEQESVQGSPKIWARQARLNNQPFAVRINVNSQSQQPAVVRIFLGPKHDEHGKETSMNENRLNFFEMDKFQVQLQPGSNNIVRNSDQMNVVDDSVGGQQLRQQVQQALNGQQPLQIQYSDILTAFPERLLLPKGKQEGQMFQLYVIVSPLVQSSQQQQTLQQLQNSVLGQADQVFQKGILNQNVDALPLGYPFDREIDESVFYNIPNAQVRDVVIVHHGGEIEEAQQEIQKQALM